MAIIYRATLKPTKPEIIASWLDGQLWGGEGAVEVLGSYRFDDPEGQVGVEAVLVRRGESVLHVPMTYRGEPLDGAEQHLISTMDHSVLGKRWIYEGSHDPVAVECFTRALAGEQEQAELDMYDGEERVERRVPDVRLNLRGEAATSGGDLRIATILDDALVGSAELVASWSEGEAVVAVR